MINSASKLCAVRDFCIILFPGRQPACSVSTNISFKEISLTEESKTTGCCWRGRSYFALWLSRNCFKNWTENNHNYKYVYLVLNVPFDSKLVAAIAASIFPYNILLVFLQVSVRNVYVFPGTPSFMELAFTGLEHLFASSGATFHSREVTSPHSC